MKRKIIGLVCTAVLAGVLLTGCSAGGGENKETAQNAEEKREYGAYGRRNGSAGT